ncbi:MAG: class I SAM-dependent methyltransferase [Vicinamibacterales bacterium]
MTALDVIVRRIHERGPLTVADFMSIALHHPEHGYYATAARRTGRNGDFFTSVDVGPMFGALLARQFAEMWRFLRDPRSAIPHPRSAIRDPRSALRSPESAIRDSQAVIHDAAGGQRTAESRGRNAESGEAFDLVEAAASDGQLARDVLDWAQVNDPDFYRAIRLRLVESSPAARAAQAEVLAPHAEKFAGSGARLPDVVHGVIFANELLDALPVHSVVMTAQGLREHYIDVGPGGRLLERVGRPSSDALEHYLATAGVRLEPGWRAEINLAALAWIARAARALRRGFLLLIDYGHEAHELYSATHAAGTLTTFHRHVTGQGGAPGKTVPATPPWLVDPGGRDITSHVDLTGVARAASERGCTTLGILDQTYFLLALGLPDLAAGDGPSLAETRRRLALKTLIMPGGLGSTHKVMVFGKDVEAAPLQGLSGMRRLT